MANHLIIGLGGTGGKILRALRKRIYAEFGSNTETGDAHLDYIYVDSDPRDLNDNDSWKYQGHPVHLAARQKVSIHGFGGGVLANLDNYPGLRAFISDEDRQLMRNDQVSALITAAIGGQRRRLGRMLLAFNVVSQPTNGFHAVLQQRINEMVHDTGNGEVVFHICAGLAGGTGSGTIVDVVSLLHQINRDRGVVNAEVYLYLYLPENQAGKADVQGFYYSNGYAALQELNALSVKAYHPIDITGKKDLVTGQVRRLCNVGNPFKMAWLFSEINEDNHVLSKDDKLPTALGDFLYQRIIASAQSQDTHMGKIEQLENNPPHPENDEDGFPVHSRNFITLGIKRIVYPENKIKAYTYNKNDDSIIAAMLCNMWNQRSGYGVITDEEAGFGLAQEARTPATQESFWLDYPSVTLQRPITDYPASDDWSSYYNYWNEVCNGLAADVCDTEKDRHDWLPSFQQLCETQKDEMFRERGVRRYFTTQRKAEEVNRHAAVICKRMENKLFGEWIDGLHGEQTWSLQKTLIFLQELEKATIERIPNIAAKKAEIQTEKEKNAEEMKKMEDRIKDTGWLLHILFGLAKKYFMEYAKLKAIDYTCETELEACDYAEKLLQEIIARIHGMVQTVERLQNLLIQGKADAEALAAVALSRTQYKDGEVQVTDEIYAPEYVHDEVERLLLLDKDSQSGIFSDVMAALKANAEGSNDASPFLSAYNYLGGLAMQAVSGDQTTQNTETLLGFIAKQSEVKIQKQLETNANNDATKQLLGVNILNRIRQDCPTEALLEQYLTGIKQECKVQLQWNDEERGQDGVVNIAEPGLQICLPEGNAAYRNLFKQKCQDVFEGVAFDEHNSICKNDAKNEILFVMVYSGFPLRFIQNVRLMKERYDNLISVHNESGALNRMLLHTESFADGKLPSIYRDGPSVVRRRAIKTTLMIYHVENMIRQLHDPVTGKTRYVINTSTDRMNPNYVDVDPTFDVTKELLCNNREIRRIVSPWVKARFNEAYPTSEAKIEVSNKIEDFLFTTVLEQYGGNELDPRFAEVRDAANELINDLKNG